jgi:hypothetical protein
LSGARLPTTEILDKLERTDVGFIVYKWFGETSYSTPESWEVEPESVIKETVNPCRTDPCGSGVNVGTLDWVQNNTLGYTGEIWKCLIRYEWVDSLVIPYSSDGKFRCGKLELIGEIS